MVSEISDKVMEMRSASLDEAAGLLRDIAGGRRGDESLKGLYRRLGRKLVGWSPNRIRDIWVRDPRVCVRASEVEQLRALAKCHDQDKADGDELADLRQRIARLEALYERAIAPVPGSGPDLVGSARGEMG